MTDLDDDEALILAQARRALGPTGADERRVLQSLLPQLALRPGPPSGSSLPGPSGALRAVRAMTVIGAVALSGGLGYRMGLQAGIAQQNQAVIHAQAVVVASAIAAQTKLELAPPFAPAARTAPSAPAAPAAREQPLPSVVKSLAPPSAARTTTVSPASSAAPGLDEEVRQLRRVERAIRESNPRFALVLLEELDRVLPAGQLLEERRAASIMASCQLGADAAVTDARAFVVQHTASAYLTRVIEICGLESERNSAAPGTHVPR